MGITAPIDFTKVNPDGGADSPLATIHPLDWVVFKGGDSFYLVYQILTTGFNMTQGRLETHISAPLFRFNKFSQRNIGRISMIGAQAWDCDGHVYAMGKNHVDEADANWAVAFWEHFWNSVHLPTPFEVHAESFYIPVLGAEHLKPRKVIPKTRMAIHPGHRHYNLSHLRLKAGMPASQYDGFNEDNSIDSYLGAKKNDVTGVVEEQIWPRGGVTLSYVMMPNKKVKDVVSILYSFSICNVQDLYNRKVGANMSMMKLWAALNGEKACRVVEMQDKSYRFQGTGTVSFVLTHSRIRPTKADGTGPFYEFTAPFFPANVVMQRELVRHVLKTLEVEAPGHALCSVHDTLNCAAAHLTEILDRFEKDYAKQVLKACTPKLFIDLTAKKEVKPEEVKAEQAPTPPVAEVFQAVPAETLTPFLETTPAPGERVRPNEVRVSGHPFQELGLKYSTAEIASMHHIGD